MRPAMRRSIVIVAACAVLAGGAYAVVHRGTPAEPVASAAAAPDVPTARAVFGSYMTRVRAQGRVGAPSGGEARLAFTNAGIVARIDVRVGEAVVAGEPLAELDTGGLAIDLTAAAGDARAAAAGFGGGAVPARALAGANARLAVARDRLRALQTGTGTAQSDRATALAAVRQSSDKVATDERALERETTLYAGGVAAFKDVEAARTQLAYDSADADAARSKAASAGASIGSALTQARADLAQARSDVAAGQAQITVSGAQAATARARYAAAQRTLALAVLRARNDGVVTMILKHPGEAVDPSQPALVVGPPSSSVVTLTAAVDDAHLVRPGDRATISLTGRHASIAARVRNVVPSVDATTQSSTIVVAGLPAGAVPGDAVEASIDVGVRRGIIIPTSAIVEDPQSGKSIVFVRERAADAGEKFVSREIQIATGDDTTSLVQSGLRNGERVATQGAFDLLAAGGGG